MISQQVKFYVRLLGCAALLLVSTGCGASLTQLRSGSNYTVQPNMLERHALHLEQVRFCAERADTFYNISRNEERAGLVLPYIGAGIATTGVALSVVAAHTEDTGTRDDWLEASGIVTAVGAGIATAAALINWTDRAREDRLTAYDMAIGAYELAASPESSSNDPQPSAAACVEAARRATRAMQFNMEQFQQQLRELNQRIQRNEELQERH